MHMSSTVKAEDENGAGAAGAGAGPEVTADNGKHKAAKKAKKHKKEKKAKKEKKEKADGKGKPGRRKRNLNSNAARRCVWRRAGSPCPRTVTCWCNVWAWRTCAAAVTCARVRCHRDRQRSIQK